MPLVSFESYTELTQKASYVCDVVFEEWIQNNHMSLLAKENVVSKILYDLCHHHQATS